MEHQRFSPKCFKPFDRILVFGCWFDENGYKKYGWKTSLFSHMTGKLVITSDIMTYAMAIPYSDDTKKLIGKDEDCPEYYKWWEDGDPDKRINQKLRLQNIRRTFREWIKSD